MAYIGKSPDGTGVRSRFYFTATGGETSLSGTDDNNATLVFADGAYVDVYLNGILLVAGTDYNTSTANTIAGLTALAANDIVEILVFDIFTVADTVSASSGGTFNAAITANQVNADNLRLDGNTISSTDTNGNVTIDPNGTGAVGLCVTPEAFNTVDGAAQVGTRQTLTSFSNDVGIGYNHYYNSGWKYTNADVARRFSSTSTVPFIWQYAASGSADAAITWSEAMRIDDSGRVLTGVASSMGSGRLQVDATTSFVYCQVMRANASNAGFVLFQKDDGSTIGSIDHNASNTRYLTTSDHRLKENVADMTGAITRVKQLAPKRYNFISDPNDTTVDGFLAHEAQTIVPNAVSGTHNEVDDDGNAIMQGIDHSAMVPLLTGALQEAIAMIETLEAKVTALENA